MTPTQEFFAHTHKYANSDFYAAEKLNKVLVLFAHDDTIVEDSKKEWEKKKKNSKYLHSLITTIVSLSIFTSLFYVSNVFGTVAIIFGIIGIIFSHAYYFDMRDWYNEQIRYCKPLTETPYCMNLLQMTENNKNVEKYVKLVNKKRQLYLFDRDFAMLIDMYDSYESEKELENATNAAACKQLHTI
ncbi:hypothetical protein [Synechococcus phage BUCT-ZZ01]|nr:hypothetical protein [Synechococcus phage BUCT-ZZ01]